MEKINLPPFYVGQKVVYITGKNMPKNSIHTVLWVGTFLCGCPAIKIETNPKNYSIFDYDTSCTHLKCPMCGKTTPLVETIEYEKDMWQANAFSPIEDIRFPLLKISEIREKERNKEFQPAIFEPQILGDN